MPSRLSRDKNNAMGPAPMGFASAPPTIGVTVMSIRHTVFADGNNGFGGFPAGGLRWCWALLQHSFLKACGSLIGV
ncbi:hypothetical protein AFLA_009527 [Aspergillus flavus NRRL3357]|nr:hypothetical protein AFLA_009527 [Aspergillus flavus NRRL3357]